MSSERQCETWIDMKMTGLKLGLQTHSLTPCIQVVPPSPTQQGMKVPPPKELIQKDSELGFIKTAERKYKERGKTKGQPKVPILNGETLNPKSLHHPPPLISSQMLAARSISTPGRRLDIFFSGPTHLRGNMQRY